jgi:hypothetical protein
LVRTIRGVHPLVRTNITAAAVGPMKVGPITVGPIKVGPIKVGPIKVGPIKVGPMKAGPTFMGPTAAAVIFVRTNGCTPRIVPANQRPR